MKSLARMDLLTTRVRIRLQHSQILDLDLEAWGANPGFCLLINHRRRRKIVGHVAPLAAGANDLAQIIRHSTKRIVPLLVHFTDTNNRLDFRLPIAVT
jgi:hypothetical protein